LGDQIGKGNSGVTGSYDAGYEKKKEKVSSRRNLQRDWGGSVQNQPCAVRGPAAQPITGTGETEKRSNQQHQSCPFGGKNGQRTANQPHCEGISSPNEQKLGGPGRRFQTLTKAAKENRIGESSFQQNSQGKETRKEKKNKKKKKQKRHKTKHKKKKKKKKKTTNHTHKKKNTQPRNGGEGGRGGGGRGKKGSDEGREAREEKREEGRKGEGRGR